MADLCLCKHLKTYHTGKDGRGKCVDSHRVWFFKPPAGAKGVFLEAKRAAELIPKLKAHQQDRILRRGYLILNCTCSMYHTVELGKIKLAGPDELAAELEKQAKRA